MHLQRKRKAVCGRGGGGRREAGDEIGGWVFLFRVVSNTIEKGEGILNFEFLILNWEARANGLAHFPYETRFQRWPWYLAD